MYDSTLLYHYKLIGRLRKEHSVLFSLTFDQNVTIFLITKSLIQFLWEPIIKK